MQGKAFQGANSSLTLLEDTRSVKAQPSLLTRGTLPMKGLTCLFIEQWSKPRTSAILMGYSWWLKLRCYSESQGGCS